MTIESGILLSGIIYLSDGYLNQSSSKVFSEGFLISGTLNLSDSYLAIDNRNIKSFSNGILVSGNIIFSDTFISLNILNNKVFNNSIFISPTTRPGLETDNGILIVNGFYTDFSASPLNVIVDEEGIQFISSTYGPAIKSWLWNFGDGTTSTQQNPLHFYSESGIFSPSLTVTSVNDEQTYFKRNDYIFVSGQPTGNLKLYPVINNQRISPYKAGTNDQIQVKYQLFGDNKTRLSYLNNVPIRLKLNYSGWQAYESSTTNRTGSQTLYHSCVGISGVNSCLGYVVATIDGKIYKSNITRFNFI